MRKHPFDELEPRGKAASTVRAMETWVQRAQDEVGISAGRVGWMVASGIVIAALQRALHHDGHPRLLIKGGAYLEQRLGLAARATKDLDTLLRGSFDDLDGILQEGLAQPFCGITFRRGELVRINVPGRLNKPYRIEVSLQLRGRTWRRIPVEISADEGNAGARADVYPTPSLAHFGVTLPKNTAGITIDYQVAQKLHACSVPHTPEHPNDRVRDVVDLWLLKTAFYDQEACILTPLANACRDVFAARIDEARTMAARPPRSWPPTLFACPGWQEDYRIYAEQLRRTLPLDETIQQLNGWIAAIDAS